MENKTLRKPYKAGLYYRLTEDVGPIPKGIYKLSYLDSELVIFLVGKNVVFSIAGSWQKLVRPLARRRALALRTSEGSFLDKYYELLAIHRQNPAPYSPLQPITICNLDPSVARELN